MGSYRVRDLLLPPTLVSLLRIPLGIAFMGASREPALALSVLLLAGGTDVLDGYLARRLGQATPTGAVVDGVLDKLFAFLVVGTLVARGLLPWSGACLLAMRELGELPLVAWWVVHRHRRKARAEDPRANWSGKLATVIQFMAIGWLLIQGNLPIAWLMLTALTGAASAALYWRRELRATHGACSRGTLRADGVNGAVAGGVGPE